MQKRTKAKVATLLYATSVTLAAGRPRKRPGGHRPLVENGRYSLLGALAADRKALGFTRHVQTLAELEIARAGETTEGWWDSAWCLDFYECDTRAIQRILRAAAKRLEVEAADLVEALA